MRRRLSHRRWRRVRWRIGDARHIRPLHEILPDFCRQRAAGDALHRAVIVIADPDADDEAVVEPDEPCIAIILGGSGLAGREAVQIRSAAGAVLDHAPQQSDQLALVLSEIVLRPTGAADRYGAGILRGL